MWERIVFFSKRFCHSLTTRSHFDIKCAISNKIQFKNINDAVNRIKKLQFPNIIYDESSQNSLASIYPSSIEEYNECCEKLTDNQIDFTKNFINPKQDILLQNMICTSEKIEGYETNNFNEKLKFYYDLPNKVINKYFFKNSPFNKIFSYKKYYLYDKIHYKISPNILRIQNFSKLNENKIRNILQGYTINRIDPPNTSYGFWLVYIGDKNSYINILSNEFIHENKFISIKPYYQTANIYPIGEKSKNIIEIYSRDKRLADKEKLKNILNCEDCNIFTLKEDNGVFYTIYFNDLNSYENVLYKNGLQLNGTCDYFMNFGDKISIDNILLPPIYLNFQSQYKIEIMEKLKNFDYEIFKDRFTAIIKPRNEDELNKLNEGIQIYDKIFYISASRQVDIKNKNYIIVDKSKDQSNNEDYLKLKFHPIPFLSYEEKPNNFNVYFKPEDYFSAYFKNSHSNMHQDKHYSTNVRFFKSNKTFLMPFYLQIHTKDENIKNIKIPFRHYYVSKKDAYSNIVKVKFKDFVTYSFQKVEIDGKEIKFYPVNFYIKNVRTFLKCDPSHIKNYQIELSKENILCDIDLEKSMLFIQLKSKEQVRKLFFLFHIWNFNKNSTLLEFGEDILNLY